jgi:hypothetical protein
MTITTAPAIRPPLRRMIGYRQAHLPVIWLPYHPIFPPNDDDYYRAAEQRAAAAAATAAEHVGRYRFLGLVTTRAFLCLRLLLGEIGMPPWPSSSPTTIRTLPDCRSWMLSTRTTPIPSTPSLQPPPRPPSCTGENNNGRDPGTNESSSSRKIPVPHHVHQHHQATVLSRQQVGGAPLGPRTTSTQRVRCHAKERLFATRQNKRRTTLSKG